MSNSPKAVIQGPSIGFCSLLTIVFIVLKLTHYIDWSWWWVLSPLWLPTALVLGIFYFFAGLWLFANSKRRY